MSTTFCHPDYIVLGMQNGEQVATLLRLVALIISVSIFHPWLDAKKRQHMKIFCLHWASAVTYVVSQFIMSVMVINCWSSKARAGPVIYLLKFIELTSINLWAISSMAIALLIASIVQAFSKMRRVPRVIGSSRVIWSCIIVAVGLALLSASFWKDIYVTGSYFWVTNTKDPRLSRWISLSFVTTQGFAGVLMALALLFVVTGERRKSLLVCIRTSKRMKLYSILSAFGTCVYLYNGFVLLFDELSRLGSAKKELTMVGWCSKYLHVVAETLVLYYAFQGKDPHETDRVPPESTANTGGGGGGGGGSGSGRPRVKRDGGACCPGDIENNEHGGNGNSSSKHNGIIPAAITNEAVVPGGVGAERGDDGRGRNGRGGPCTGGRGGNSSASTGTCSGDTDGNARSKLDSDFSSVSGSLVAMDKGDGGGGGGGHSLTGSKLDSDFSISGSLVGTVDKDGDSGSGGHSPLGAGGRNAPRPDTSAMKSAYSSRSSSLSSGDSSNSFRVAVAAAALGSRTTWQRSRQRQHRQEKSHQQQQHRQKQQQTTQPPSAAPAVDDDAQQQQPLPPLPPV